jgi:pimeloyl-ACP methyl ester carboxylesterase
MAEDATTAAAPRKSKNPYGEDSPEAFAPLAPYGGERPPAPEWFDKALQRRPERSFVDAPGGKLELLTWGEVGKPGLIFIHGNGSHAHWWAHIAPFFADDYRVAAFSLAGHGASDWRDTYSAMGMADDAEACARAAGLHEGGGPPIYIGHSLGGAMSFCVAEQRPEQMRAAVLIDCSFKGPTSEGIAAMAAEMEARKAAAGGSLAPRLYASETEALARFRLAPPQQPRNHFIIDYVARTALSRSPRPDGAGEGFAWSHDPAMWVKMDRGHEQGPFPDGPIPVEPPLVHLAGDRSHVTRFRQPNADPLAPDVPVITMPDCGHNTMIDQPLALVATLRTLLAIWPA